MSGEPKTHTPERFQHRHPVEAIRFTGANASDIYKFVGWEVPGDRVRLDNKAGVMRLWTAPPIHAGDWLVRRPQPLHKSEAACRPRRYVVYTDVDFHATFEPVGVPVVARDEANEQRDGLLLIARALGMTSEDQGRIANVATPEEMAAEIERLREEADELRAAILRVHHAEQDLKRWQQIEYDDETQRFCDEIEWYAAAGRAQAELMKLAERLASEEGGAS